MKTLLFTLEYPPTVGGVANYYENFVKNWPKREDVVVLDNNDGKLIKNYLYPKWLLAFYRLRKTIKKEKIEHIIVGHILPLGTVTYFLTKFFKIPYSVVLHGMDFAYTQKTKRKKKISKKILIKAKNIICANSFTASLVKNILKDKDKVYIVNPGIDIYVAHNTQHITQIRKKYNLEGKIVLFSLGRLVKRKGFDTVLETLPEAQKSVPNLVYVIAGEGPDKVYLKEKSRGVNNVIFLGKINDNDKWAWLKNCDIFIMPTRNIEGDFEGFGIVYLEASLMRKPIIAGKSGGVEDAVKNSYSGILVDPGNKSRLTEVIVRLAQDQELRQKLGEQGRERAINEFNWQKKAEKFYNIINK